MKKLISARFWLAIIAGGVFAYTAVIKILPPEAVATVITMVFSLYFSRSDRNEE